MNLKSMIILPMLFFLRATFGQVLYIDPVTSGAMLAHSSVINSQLSTTNNNLTAIQRGQLAVSGQLVIVNNLQAKIYNGLTEVAGVVSSLGTIKEIADIGVDITGNIQKAVSIARTNPALLLFAEEGAREFKARAASLSLEVSAFVLKGGKDNLMDSGERAKMLNHIAEQLRILRGVAYGMERAMFWAKTKGLWASLNPWEGWHNMDVQIAGEVISQAKYLKK
jgi:hypothetical protein